MESEAFAVRDGQRPSRSSGGSAPLRGFAPTPPGARAAAAVFLLFAAVPLAVSPLFWDQYVTVKWYVLEALAALWLMVEVWACGSHGLPRFLVRHRWLALTLLALEAATVLRQGLGAALSPLVERVAVAALALCAYWSLRRPSTLAAARAGTLLALALVLACGFQQAAGHDPLAALDASDRRGSLFGNANMGAQYAALAALLLLATARARPLWRAAVDVLLAAATVVWLALLSTRSVFAALVAGVAAAWLARHPTRWRRAAAGGVIAALALGTAWWIGTRTAAPLLRANKAASLSFRMALWADSARLARDHPLGVGTGGFEDVFRAYQATGATAPDEDEVFRHPHDEYLRLAAEEGLPFLLLALAFVALLARDVVRRAGRHDPHALALLAGWAAFLLVEALFQFPFALAFGALALAVAAGLAFAGAEGAAPRPAAAPMARVGWRLGASAAAAFVLLGAGAVALSEYLFVSAPRGEAAQERACVLDARNLPACVMAAWLRGTRGDLDGARARLLRVLDRAPHYPPAMKLLAQQTAVAGDHEAACLALWTYDQLFRGQSSLHGDLLATCSDADRARAAARVPTPHYGRYPLAR